ncbi:MAG: spondin domain-containing protein, partial [Bacteroidetes bacterium]|nr:spondin domain-containing protein [Bacteroidota bacterium]
MNQLSRFSLWPAAALLPFFMSACKKDNHSGGAAPQMETITVENVLDSRPLVESGTFQGTGSPALIQPGQSVTITFAAAKGEALSFATMYGWSNDLFFAPANPGIQVYNGDGTPIEGDVSGQIRLWDNGTRINQA